MSGVSLVAVSDDDDGIRLDKWFKRHYPNLPLGRLQKLLRTGQIRLDGSRAKANARLSTGQEIRVPPLGELPTTKPKDRNRLSDEDARDLRAMVLHRDDHVIVLNKPPGLATQGGSGQAKHLDGMLDGLRFGAKDRPKLVHRLDKDTSGVLVLARSAQAAQALTQAFKAKTARKVYWALVVGVPKPLAGHIDLAISKQGGGGNEKMRPDPDGQRARTDYWVVEKAGRRASWLHLEPLTGRTHQLRVHCWEALATPIQGDGKYGGAEAFLDAPEISRKLHLHARAIRIPHPTGGELSVHAPLPDHMARTWDYLGFDIRSESDPFEEPDF